MTTRATSESTGSRHSRLIGVVAVVALAIAACAGGGAGGTGGAGGATDGQGSAGDKKTISIGIDLPVHPFFNYLAANSEEYFGDTPWKLDMQVYSAQAQVSEMVQGNLDIITSPAFAMPRIEQQAPDLNLQYFWPVARYASWSGFLVAADSPVQSLEDLQGKRLAAPPLESEHGSEIAAFYGATGTPPGEYFNFVETEQPAAALQTGRADAALLDPIGKVELLQSGDYREVTDLAGLWESALDDDRPVLSGGFIADRSFIEENRAFVEKLVQVNREIWMRFMEDEQFRQQVYEDGGRFAGVPPGQLQAVAEGLDLTSIDPELLAVTDWDAEVYAQAFEWARKGGFDISKVDDPSQKFVLTEDLGIE